MSAITTSMIRSRPVASAAIAIAAVGAVTILGAWIFQYGLGLQPCPLCLEQRYAYYFAIPLALMVLVGDQVGASRKVLFAALVAIALGMLWNAGLGVYHSGIEWKWWAGPQECTGTLGDLGSAGGSSTSSSHSMWCAATRPPGVSWICRVRATTRSFRSRLHALRRGRRRWSGALASTSGGNETGAFTSFLTRQARCESSRLRA